MRWLVDAQLPKRIASALNHRGHTATHTLDLPNANATTDAQVIEFAASNSAVVISKDYDFVNYFHLTGKPRLLLISTGNITNNELLDLILKQLPQIEKSFALFDLADSSTKCAEYRLKEAEMCKHSSSFELPIPRSTDELHTPQPKRTLPDLCHA